MGDTTFAAKLTSFDMLSVSLYRLGIVVSTLCIIYGSVYFYYALVIRDFPDLILFSGTVPYIMFWLFVVSVGTSAFFLHLYSKTILRFIQLLYVLGFLLILALSIFSDNVLSKAFTNAEFGIGKLVSLGIAFVLAAFSAVGAKEAYCFKLKEGYLYAISSFTLVIVHLVGSMQDISLFLLIIISILTTIFSIRKLGHPLYYDIGDKSKYQQT